MKCLISEYRILNSLLLCMMIVLCFQFSCCNENPYTETDYPKSFNHIAYVDFTTTNLDLEVKNNYIANFNHYALKLIKSYLVLKFRKVHKIALKDIIIMKDLTVMFNADTILRPDIFGHEYKDRQNKLSKISNIIKTKYSSRFQNCRFFFSTYPIDSNLKLPVIVKKFQWIHLNSLCFDSFQNVIQFDANFSREFENFFQNKTFSNLKMFESESDNISILVDYKAKVRRTISEESNENDPFHMGYLGMNDDGVMISVVNDFSVNNVIYSFPYNEIVDCDDKYIFAIEKDYGKCFNFQLQLNGIFTNTLYACPKSITSFQKILQFRYFTNVLDKKCVAKIQELIEETFNAFRNPSDIFTLYEKYSTQVISKNLLSFIKNQIHKIKSDNPKSATKREMKLIFMFRHFDKDMKDYLKKSEGFENIKEIMIKSLDSSFKIIVDGEEKLLNNYPPLLMTENGYFNEHPESKGALFGGYDSSIWKICSSHPNFIECLCAAYPFSKVCKENYCVKNKNTWECDRDFCSKNKGSQGCECKSNPNDYNCKCKMNPLLKECLCARYPSALYCKKDFCSSNEINYNHMYCICNNNKKAKICQPDFCLKNLKSPQCKCLSNPKDFSCYCELNPKSDQCAGGKMSAAYLNHLKTIDKNFVYPPKNKHLSKISNKINKKSKLEGKNSGKSNENKDRINKLESNKSIPNTGNKIYSSKKKKSASEEIKKMKKSFDFLKNKSSFSGKSSLKVKDISNKPEERTSTKERNSLSKKESLTGQSAKVKDKSGKLGKQGDKEVKDKSGKLGKQGDKEVKDKSGKLGKQGDKEVKDKSGKLGKQGDKEVKQIKRKKLFEKLNSKFRNPSNPNFNLFYKFDKFGNIIPKKGQLKFLNPSNPQFSKYYKKDKFGKIVPKMSPTNPNFNLFYKKDKFGNILPRKFLLKNKSAVLPDQMNKPKDKLNKNSKKAKSSGPQANRITFNITSPQITGFYNTLFGSFRNPIHPKFKQFFKKNNKGSLVPKQLNLLNPYNPRFRDYFKINKLGRIIPNPNPSNPLFSLFYDLNKKTMSSIPKEFLSKLGLNKSRFDPRFDGKANPLFRNFNPYGSQNFLPKLYYKKLVNLLPKKKIKGPDGEYFMPDGRKLGKPFGKMAPNGKWLDINGKPLSPPYVHLAKDGKLYGPDGKPVGPAAVKGPDGKYYGPDGKQYPYVFGKLAPNGRYYNANQEPFGPKGKLANDGNFYDSKKKLLGKYAKIEENGNYAGQLGILKSINPTFDGNSTIDKKSYVDGKGNPIEKKKSLFGLRGFNPFGKNGVYEEFDYKEPKVTMFYNKMYGKFSDPKDENFPYYFKFNSKGNIVPLPTMLAQMNPYNPMFKRLFKINVKGRIVPNDTPVNPQFKQFYDKDKDGKVTAKKFLENMNLNTHFRNKMFDDLKFNPYDFGLGKKYKIFDPKNPNVIRYYDTLFGKYKNPNNESFNEFYQFNKKGKIKPKNIEIRKLDTLSLEFSKTFEFNKAGKIVPRVSTNSPIFNDFYSQNEKGDIVPNKKTKDLEYIEKFNFDNPELKNYYNALFAKFRDPKNKEFKKYFKYKENGKLIPNPTQMRFLNPKSSVFFKIYKIRRGKPIPKANPLSPLFKSFYKKNRGKLIPRKFFKKLKLGKGKFKILQNFRKIKLSYGPTFSIQDPNIYKYYMRLNSKFINPKNPFFNHFFNFDSKTQKIVPLQAELKIINPDHEDFLDFYEYNRFGRIIPRKQPTNKNYKLFYDTDPKGFPLSKDFLLNLHLDYFAKAISNFKKTFSSKGNKSLKNNKKETLTGLSVSKTSQFNSSNKYNMELKKYYEMLYAKFNKPGDKNFDNFFKFDKDGKIVPKQSQLSRLNPNDFEKFYKFYEFNINGLVIPRIESANPYFNLFYRIDQKGDIYPKDFLASIIGNLPRYYEGFTRKDVKDFNINDKNLIEIYKKLYSKYMDNNHPNFKSYFTVNKDGNTIPRPKKLKYMDPENKDFIKYYEFDKKGNIIPRISVNNPNQRLFFKFNEKGNLIPNDYLMERLKNKNAFFPPDSKEFKDYLANKQKKLTNNNLVKKSNKDANNKFKTCKIKDTKEFIKEIGSQIKVSYSKDANENHIISLSRRKQGNCKKNTQGDNNLLPNIRQLPGENGLIIKKAANPVNREIDDDLLNKQCEGENLPEISVECDKNDIYCLCRNHPQYKDCVCLAFPKSIICSNSYCLEHKDEYECSPQQCDSNQSGEQCYCKNNMDDVKCKCKINPYDRECFCLQNPLSHLCNNNACKINPNSLFCSCQTNLRNKMCTPRYCFENPSNVYCKCIVSPLSDECRCLNDPTFCEKREFMEAITEYDIKIRDDCANNKLFYSVNPFFSRNDTSNISNYVLYNNQTEKLIVDPQIIFNMYYPSCSYNPDSPNSGDSNKVNGNSACIPFPDPPSSGVKNANSITDVGTCIDNKTYLARRFLRKSNAFVNRYNKLNFKNVKRKFHLNKIIISNVMMIYNKLLLFNSKSEKKIIKTMNLG